MTDPRGESDILNASGGVKDVGYPGVSSVGLAYSRLEYLYEISKCLARFESVETTFPKILGLAAKTFPISSAVLIEKRGAFPNTCIWPTNIDSERNALTVAKARSSYHYLLDATLADSDEMQLDPIHTVRLSAADPIGRDSLDIASSVLVFPLVVDREPVYGVMLFDAFGALDEADVHFADALANLIAVALDRHYTAQNERDVQSQLKLALKSAQMGTWRIDIKSGKLKVSEQTAKIFGILRNGEEAAELVNRAVLEEDRVSVKRAWREAVAGCAPYYHEYRIRRDDGDVRWVSAQGSAKLGQDGRPLYYSGVISDITERVVTRKRLEFIATELVRAKKNADSATQSADHANQAKTNFLANMSHEIRTPVTAILGFAELLSDGENTKGEVSAFASTIVRNSHHLLRIIDDILDLTKVEAGKIAIEKTHFAFTDFMADVITGAVKRAGERGNSFHFAALSELPEFLISDPTRLRQILTNIIGNAIKFTSSGRIDLGVSFVKRELKFTVSDSERGISEEQRPRLFQAFMQADASTTRKFGGTGLGLVLTKKLTQALGGDFILLGSELDKGSTFEARVTVEVPAGTRLLKDPEFRAVSVPESAARPLKARLQDFEILLVEDSPDNQVLIQKILGKTGAKLTLALDGLQGLRLALEHAYDVILMDIQMPGMDGHEVVRTLRARNYKGIIVALTAHAMNEERERTVASGFTHFLSKPIDRLELLGRLAVTKAANSLN